MTTTTARPPASRRFGLFDAMLLVAATAAGLAATRPLVEGITWEGLANLARSVHDGGWPGGIILILVELGTLTTPLALAWTLAILASGLRRPRPRWRQIMRHPGLVSGLAIVAALVVCGGPASLAARLLGRMADPIDFFLGLSTVPGVAVAGAWTTLIAGRRWRAQATWIDRLGRLLGVYWLVLAMPISAFLCI